MEVTKLGFPATLVSIIKMADEPSVLLFADNIEGRTVAVELSNDKDTNPFELKKRYTITITEEQ